MRVKIIIIIKDEILLRLYGKFALILNRSMRTTKSKKTLVVSDMVLVSYLKMMNLLIDPKQKQIILKLCLLIMNSKYVALVLWKQ